MKTSMQNQADYIQEYYYMVHGNRHSMGAFLSDIQEHPDLTIRQMLEFFSIGIYDSRQEDEEDED
mgnify:CR=1 FL=1|jgi:hypothetical protein